MTVNTTLPPDWTRRALADTARRRKAQRRFLAHLEALWGYHPLHQAQSAMPNWWIDLVVDPDDDDGPVGECYCNATPRPPCGVCEPSR